MPLIRKSGDIFVSFIKIRYAIISYRLAAPYTLQTCVRFLLLNNTPESLAEENEQNAQLRNQGDDSFPY